MFATAALRGRIRRLVRADAASAPAKNKGTALVTAFALLILVVSFEWHVDLEFSLGVFYVFPIIAAASVLNRVQIVVAALFCAYIRGLFTPGFTPVEFWLRFAMATLAYSGVGLFVVETNRSRRKLLAAYARLKLEKEMRHRAEDQLRILADSSPAAIVTLDVNAEVLAANRAAHEMLGYSYPSEMIGKNLDKQIPIFAGALRLSPGRRQIRTSASSWAKRVNGITFPVATWFSTYGEGDDLRLAGILVDTSEEVRERERDNFRHMLDYNRLLADAVSHEIRNMCSAIRVVTANLGRRPEMLKSADFGALQSLVDSLASIASFDLGKGKRKDLGWLSLNDLLEQLRIVIEPDWSDLEGSILWDLPVPSPRVQADAHGLLQIFLNLSQNALRAVHCTARPLLHIAGRVNENMVTVSFTDNGPGVPDPSILFQPFRPEANGTGLGLYISRTLANSFGGQLKHVPSLSGCRFDLLLPLQE